MMKLKPALKYQIVDTTRPFLIFYGVIYTLFIISIILVNLTAGDTLSTNGFDVASMIFIFIAGLNIFKAPFLMFLQNGISRKTMFVSSALSLLILSGTMAAIDTVNALISSNLLVYKTVFDQFYADRYLTIGMFSQIFDGLVWKIAVYYSLAMFGFLTTTLYYRMNKPLKLLVSIGIPVLLFVIFPIIDSYTQGFVTDGLVHLLTFLFGVKNGYNPYYCVLSCTFFSVMFGFLAYLLVRRAMVKEQ